MSNPIEIIEGLRNFEEGAGEFIRNGPSTGLPGYVRDGYRERCNQFANLPAWARLLGNGPSGAMGRICTPYWDDNGWDGPEVAPPPFEGGQCDGELYLLELGWTKTATGARQTFSQVAYGPIGAPSIAIVGGSYLMSYGNRGSRASQNCSTFPPALLAPGTTDVVSSSAERSSPGIDSISKCSGVDNCGNPPSDFPIRPGPNPPPDPGPLPGPDPTDDPDNPIGPPLIPLPPYQDPIYGPTPIVGPTGPTGPPGGGGGNDPVGGPGSPGSGGDTGAGGEQDGEAEPGGELVGVLVQVLSAPTDANRFFNNAAVVYRGAYYVAMGYPGRLGLDMSGGTAEALQFFHAQQRGLTDYRVRANVGFNLRVTPYYRDLES